MVYRTLLLILLGGVGISYSLSVPKVITVTITSSTTLRNISTGLSRHSSIYQNQHRHLIIRKQTTNPEDEKKKKKTYNNNDIDPDELAPPFTKFEQTRQSRRSADFPPLTYVDNLLDLPFEPEVSFILKANRATRLVKGRSYARRDAFESENIASRPTLDDLTPPTSPNSFFGNIWISATYRLVIISTAYYSFPPLTRQLERSVTMTPDLLNELTNNFAPGISILYGTFISLTLAILYDRLKNIQNSVVTESSLISLATQNILTIFKNDEDRMVRGGQCIADQIRILVKESRGRELMALIYSDPYLRILELVAEKEEEIFTEKGSDALAARSGTIASTRDIIKDVMKVRSQRLGEEALTLPPTHFFLLISISSLILLCFTISTLPTVASNGNPSVESSFLFSVLCSVYVTFFNFAADLNNPFLGVYQIRRSCAASHLLQTKWVIANHPSMQGKVDFDDVTGDIRDIMQREDLSVWTPGLGAMMLNGDDMCTSDECKPPVVEEWEGFC